MSDMKSNTISCAGDMTKPLWVLRLSQPGLEYDANALLRGFFPQYEVKIWTDLVGEDKAALWRPFVRGSLDFDGERALLELEGVAYVLDLCCYGGDKAAVKAAVKSFLYRSLASHTGRSLAWGSLTGIRPAKMAMSLLEQGLEEGAVREKLEGEYFLRPSKSGLAVAIARRERELLGRAKPQGYSLYIGIPFCPTTCLYCSFPSYSASRFQVRMPAYVDALSAELEAVYRVFEGRAPDTLYVGGGTPTALDPSSLERLLSVINGYFPLEALGEWTVEAGRPDSLDGRKLDILRQYGGGRISINPQTMHDATLDRIGRRHSVEQTRQAFWLAREKGFDNINMDIILGLPGEGQKELAHTLEEIRRLGPESLTVHSLAVKRASHMAGAIREGYMADRRAQEDPDYWEEMLDMAYAAAGGMGMEPYYLYRQKNTVGNMENTGFAKPGRECLYNVLIMEERQSIAALGVGAISKRVGRGRIERRENPKDVELYLEQAARLAEAGAQWLLREDEDGQDAKKAGDRHEGYIARGDGA